MLSRRVARAVRNNKRIKLWNFKYILFSAVDSSALKNIYNIPPIQKKYVYMIIFNVKSSVKQNRKISFKLKFMIWICIFIHNFCFIIHSLVVKATKRSKYLFIFPNHFKCLDRELYERLLCSFFLLNGIIMPY